MSRMMLAIAVAFLTMGSAYAVDITACGQTVAVGETGVLQTDLDCSADPAENAVTLGNASTVDMNGHAIIARMVGVDCGGVLRIGSCTVRGPGEISGGNYAIGGDTRRMTVSDVDIHDVAIQGITGQKVVLTNVTVMHSEANGIIAYKQLTAENVVASGNEYVGMSSPRVSGTDVTANDNGYSGVDCSRKCKLTRLTATGNGFTDIPVGAGAGVQGGSVRLVDSTVTGNVLDNTLPLDVDSFRRPRLFNTTCDHSRRRGDPNATWGVCAAD
jgi:hypothetical protein